MKERKRRGHSRYYLFFFLALIAIGALGTGVYYLLRNLTVLELQKIEISGNKSVPDSLLNKVLKPYLGQNLLAVETKQVRKSLMAFSRIDEIKIRKSLLHTLKIEIKERSGVLYLKTVEGDLFPIDSEARVLTRYTNVLGEDLPVISSFFHSSQIKNGLKLNSPELKRVLALNARIMRDYPEFMPRISEYYTIDNTIYIVDMETGTRLIPPDEGLADQLRRYLFVQENGNIGNHKLVDLRYLNQVVVKADTK